MSHKRSKRDVQEAYRRGFEDGFRVRPNPLAMLLRSCWRKHELKKMNKAYVKQVAEMGKIESRSIGTITSFENGPDGIVAKGKFDV